MAAKILILDIETAPNIAYVWGAWKQNIGANMVAEHGYIMSYAAKWLNDDNIEYVENRHGNDRILVKKMYKLLDEADIVVAHNGKKFDIPTILGRGVVHQLPPPSPFKQVDTLLSARREFRFMHNSLAALAKQLNCAPKLAHGQFPGFELWLQCLKQNDAAWEEMKTYNIRDIVTLEEVYLRLRPYIKNHPNVGVINEEERVVCPACGSKHVHYRGYYTTNVSKFRRFRCNDCSFWGRERTNVLPKEVKKNLAANAL